VPDHESIVAPREIIVLVRKYDGSEHRRWNAELTSIEGSRIAVTGVFDADIDHAVLGKISLGTVSVEYYWTDRWYSIFRFTNPTGELRNCYCNINMPPSIEGNELSFVDLDIDILVRPDLSYSILDEDEFSENSLLFEYSDEIKLQVRTAMTELIQLIESRQFPFDASCPPA
jgi:protein associated with RNAse G/E